MLKALGSLEISKSVMVKADASEVRLQETLHGG